MNSSFQVHLTRSAEEDLIRLRDLMSKAVEEILILKQDPLKGHPLKGSLAGVRSLEFFLVGVAYRSLCGATAGQRLSGILGWNPRRFLRKGPTEG